jgi:S-methylmethionine-dependent homocysteine/selenocysteine methylase
MISGCVGPRGDGYVAAELMSADEAERYHSRQVGTFAASGVDLVSAITMTYPELDEADELDQGDLVDLGARLGELRRRLPELAVVGGCCGTDERHIDEMCRAVLAASG